MELDEQYLITSPEQLAGLYPPPSERVILKQIDHLDEHCRAFIAASPFLLLATSGAKGVDCSPRGDTPGFVEVADDKTLLLPDRPGNNRIDSMRNILTSNQVGLLFMVPGVNETLRVNGTAQLSADPMLLERFAVDDKRPRTVLVITAAEVFIQCARALIRSELWNPARHLERSSLPSTGTILAAHTRGKVDAAQYDADAPQRVASTLY